MSKLFFVNVGIPAELYFKLLPHAEIEVYNDLARRNTLFNEARSRLSTGDILPYKAWVSTPEAKSYHMELIKESVYYGTKAYHSKMELRYQKYVEGIKAVAAQHPGPRPRKAPVPISYDKAFNVVVVQMLQNGKIPPLPAKLPAVKVATSLEG